eukprot:1139839-Pelagomonas_calceolata.AAC.3
MHENGRAREPAYPAQHWVHGCETRIQSGKGITLEKRVRKGRKKNKKKRREREREKKKEEGPALTGSCHVCTSAHLLLAEEGTEEVTGIAAASSRVCADWPGVCAKQQPPTMSRKCVCSVKTERNTSARYVRSNAASFPVNNAQSALAAAREAGNIKKCVSSASPLHRHAIRLHEPATKLL